MEIETAVSRVAEQYKVQLSTAQSSLQTQDHEHQLVIQKLQSKIQSLEVLLASQVNLPSMGITHSHDGSGLHNEVFNFMPGTVNKQRGMAQYNSQDQAFSFHKQVRYEDGTSSPDLNHNATSGSIPKHQLHIVVLLTSTILLTLVRYHHSCLVLTRMLPP